MTLLSEWRSEFRQIRARPLRECQLCVRVQPPQRLVCPLPASDAFGTVCEHIGPQLGLPKGDEQGVRDSSIARDTALMQATSILLLLAALMPAASLLAQTPSPRHLVHVSAKKKPATAGGRQRAPVDAEEEEKETEDEPGLARPWDTDDSDENATRAQKRGGEMAIAAAGGQLRQPSGE